MNDNLKTWPEKIWIDSDGFIISDWDNWYKEIWQDELKDDSVIKYIRADVAKEREEKIINAIWYIGCIPLTYSYNKLDTQENEIMKIVSTINMDRIYKEAELEQLK